MVVPFGYEHRTEELRPSEDLNKVLNVKSQLDGCDSALWGTEIDIQFAIEPLLYPKCSFDRNSR